MKRVASEYQIHCAIASLLRHAALPKTIWTCFPAGEKRDAVTGARLKAMGLQRGVADFVLVIDGRACFLEIKAANGRQSPEQKAFQLACEAAGARYAMARSVTEAKTILENWSALRSNVWRDAA